MKTYTYTQWYRTYNGLLDLPFLQLYKGVKAMHIRSYFNFDLFPVQWYIGWYSLMMLSRVSQPRLIGSQVITKVNHWYSIVYCVASVFWTLCFHIPLCLQNAHLFFLILVIKRKSRQLLFRWLQDNCPNTS